LSSSTADACLLWQPMGRTVHVVFHDIFDSFTGPCLVYNTATYTLYGRCGFGQYGRCIAYTNPLLSLTMDNSWICQLADWTSRGLVNSRTRQLAYWTSRGRVQSAVSQMPPKERKLITQSRRWHPRVVQSATCPVREFCSPRVDQSARCPIREFAIRKLAYTRVVQ